ncbi:MAG: caspase family protein [Bacteroidales bacterium]
MKTNQLRTSFVVLMMVITCHHTLLSQAVKSEKSTIRINTMALGKEPDPDIIFLSPDNLKQGITFQSDVDKVPLGMKLVNGTEGVKIYVNGIEILPTSAGDFYLKQFDLQANKSSDLLVAVTKNEKKVKEYQFSLIYIPKVKNTSKYVLNPGKFYALIIGNSTYNNTSIPNLKRPVEDARALKDVLLARYTFERENIYFLTDMNKENVLIALEELQRKILPDDNLLIFYAGHGKMDEESDIGYWLLADADPSRKFTWLSNGTLTEYIKSLKARHILLVADACYAGSILNFRSLEDAPASVLDLYKQKSRTAITSGGTTEVSDESKFARFMVQVLNDNNEYYLSSAELYHQVSTAIKNNSITAARQGVIQNVGDNGGDFIFMLKEK